MKISVAHIRDGYVSYNHGQFKYSEKSLEALIEKFISEGVEVRERDVLPAPDKGSEGDAYFYVVNHRQLTTVEETGEVGIIFWLDDMNESDLFDIS